MQRQNKIIKQTNPDKTFTKKRWTAFDVKFNPSQPEALRIYGGTVSREALSWLRNANQSTQSQSTEARKTQRAGEQRTKQTDEQTHADKQTNTPTQNNSTQFSADGMLIP